MPRPNATLLEVIGERTGSLRRTYQVGKVITQWAMVREDLGRRPMVHEYATWWKVSERTAWREMARFSEAFPEEDGPDRLAQLVEVKSSGATNPIAALSVTAAALELD